MVCEIPGLASFVQEIEDLTAEFIGSLGSDNRLSSESCEVDSSAYVELSGRLSEKLSAFNRASVTNGMSNDGSMNQVQVASPQFERNTVSWC